MAGATPGRRDRDQGSCDPPPCRYRHRGSVHCRARAYPRRLHLDGRRRRYDAQTYRVRCRRHHDELPRAVADADGAVMARVGQDKIEEVRSRADIVEIVGAHVRLKRAGRNFVGLCPFHNEKTPSFTVNAERGFFHCFGCGAGGTAFDFVMRIEGLTFPEALQSLARRYGITLPERGEGAGVAAGERDAWFLANQTAAEFFAHVLWNTEDGKPARDYLKSRGITTDTAAPSCSVSRRRVPQISPARCKSAASWRPRSSSDWSGATARTCTTCSERA